MRKTMDEKQRKRWQFWLFAVFAAGCMAVGIKNLFFQGPLRENLFGKNGQNALWETIIFFIWIMAVFFFFEKQTGKLGTSLQTGGIVLGLLTGIWCHQVFLPVLFSGIWFLGLFAFGDLLFRLSGGEKGKGNKEKRLPADFLLGCGFWICLTCFLSAFHFGGTEKMRKTAAGLLLLVLLEALWHRKNTAVRAQKTFASLRTSLLEYDMMEKAALAVSLTMIFIQLARINLLPDYDSLHYGLRSPYILDAGHGIYEDLGNINLVYTYPKGLEILTYPLSGTASFSFLLCFNVWMAGFILVILYKITLRLGGSRKTALWASAFACAMPGIMNMSITAKSDLAALACQLCILYAAAELFFCREGKKGWIGIAAGGCFLSYAMKPTALVFSTVLSLSCLAVLAGKKGFYLKENNKNAGRREFSFFACVVFVCLGAWMGTWIRTYRMTGVPATSVFTSIWEKLGFQVRWPYAFSSIPDQGIAVGGIKSLGFLLKRLAGMLFAPVGEDMAHVIIAWGGCFPVLFMLSWMLWGREARGRRKDEPQAKALSCLCGAAVGTGIISLISIYLLWQVDGNYFMLMYAVLAVMGSLSLSRADKPSCAGKVFGGILLFYQVVLTISTNWAGTTGFTPIVFNNPGYYHHQQEWHERKCREGNQEIWSILAQNPETRVIAFGEHPEVLQFPCNVQSYYDVTGSGGNVRLVKTLENFKQFLRFAGTEYIYVEAGYLEEGSRAYDVVRFLIEEGSLADIRYEQGNMLGRVNLDGKIETKPKEAAEEFYRTIITAKDQRAE